MHLCVCNACCHLLCMNLMLQWGSNRHLMTAGSDEGNTVIGTAWPRNQTSRNSSWFPKQGIFLKLRCRRRLHTSTSEYGRDRLAEQAQGDTKHLASELRSAVGHRTCPRSARASQFFAWKCLAGRPKAAARWHHKLCSAWLQSPGFSTTWL